MQDKPSRAPDDTQDGALFCPSVISSPCTTEGHGDGNTHSTAQTLITDDGSGTPHKKLLRAGQGAI